MRVLLTMMLPGVLLLLMAGTGFAGMDKEEQVKIDALAEKLHLSPQQKASVVKEREKSRQILLRLEEEWQRLHDRLREEVRADKPDQARVDEIARSIGRIRGDIISLRTKSLIHLKSVLTPEQVEILEKDATNGGNADSNE